MTTILTAISAVLSINADRFHQGLRQGRKAVKLACSLGASYEAAELLAPLKLAVTADQIDEAYASPVKSCMQNRPVGRYYAQLGVQCLHSSNFRALIMPHPTTPGLWVAPRAYGVHGDRITKLLADVLIISPELFSQALPREEWVEDHSTRELVSLGVYEYTATYGQPMPSYPFSILDFALAAGPFPRYGFEAPEIWARLYADVADRFFEDHQKTRTANRVDDLPTTLTTHIRDAQGRWFEFRSFRAKLKSRTVTPPQYRVKNPTPLYFSRVKVPKTGFTPYPDYPLSEQYGVPLPAFHGVADLPDPWEDRAYAEEARFEGYRY